MQCKSFTQTIVKGENAMYYIPTGDEAFFSIIIVAIIIIAENRHQRKKAKRKEAEDKKWKEELHEQIEKEAEEAEKRIDKSKVLISEEKFDALALETRKLAKLVNRFCYESSFIDYYHKIHPEASTLVNGDDIFLDFEYILLDDILWVYDQLRHHYVRLGKNSINFDTPEGQCLYIIYESVSQINDDEGYAYRYFKGAVGDTESLSYKARDSIRSIFETLTKYSSNKSQNDYVICNYIHSYNAEYEQLYRLLMYRIAKMVAESDGELSIEEKEWLLKNEPQKEMESSSIEQSILSYQPPIINYNSNSNWDSSDDDNYDDEDDISFCDLSATVTYSVMDAPEEECDLDNLFDRDLRRLKAADDNGEYLDSDYISEHMPSIHNKIIEAIRDDLELKSGDPHDGMVEKRHPWGATYWEKDHASHQEMWVAEDYEIEYTMDVF